MVLSRASPRISTSCCSIPITTLLLSLLLLFVVSAGEIKHGVGDNNIKFPQECFWRGGIVLARMFTACDVRQDLDSPPCFARSTPINALATTAHTRRTLEILVLCFVPCDSFDLRVAIASLSNENLLTTILGS
ncbi:hypothetical protein MIMGU_mgv1a018774mg [Erythranthe guttata]|uniref:Uncharacterized protein n=1 Tax=Erythranthe guttata TaxID=4155 RepID=A0A022RBJ4_ERYGU|nr:hypothetical protein MIMGU_mgv1a018774mg [Erythranthe guttata]